LFAFYLGNGNGQAWAVATLLSNKPNALRWEEQQHALIILRQAAQSLIDRAETFNSQDLSNSLWSLATLGFGLT
jgi:hypothetical protein